jgi:hypothetical protein
MINDMNLRTADRVSALLLAIAVLLVMLSFWRPILALASVLLLVMIAVLNRQTLAFYARKRGLVFAAGAYFWQLLYFFYSGATFVAAWVWFSTGRLPGTASRQTNSGRRNDSEAAP